MLSPGAAYGRLVAPSVLLKVRLVPGMRLQIAPAWPADTSIAITAPVLRTAALVRIVPPRIVDRP
jgi:hypothetical protein